MQPIFTDEPHECKHSIIMNLHYTINMTNYKTFNSMDLVDAAGLEPALKGSSKIKRSKRG